ncbi:helix-turn-helix domain-containing protein [Pseudonocardia saturnea]
MDGPQHVTEYSAGRPHPALRGLVLRYGGYREFSTTPLRRRQAPTGSCTVILSFAPLIRLHGPAGPTVTTSFLAGMHDAAVVTEFTGVQHGLQVDLTPLGAYTLLGRPMDGLTNRVPRLDELDVPELAALPARLAADPDWPARYARVDAALLRLLDASRVRPDPEVAWAWRQLRRSGGRAGVAELAAGTGWSRRHLTARFGAQVGLAPKAAGRVLRFQRAAGLLVPAGPSISALSISTVAATCGFADHSHLVREFRALAGVTPSAYVAEWARVVPVRPSPTADDRPTVAP